MSNTIAQAPIYPSNSIALAANDPIQSATTTDASAQGSTPPPPVSPLQTALADKQNLKNLGEKLNEIAKRLGDNATPAQVLSELAATSMEMHTFSSHPNAGRGSVTLAAFIQHMGLALPTDHFSLTGLANAVSHRAMEHPLGDLGGALSWPVPLSDDAQNRLRTLAMNIPVSSVATGTGKGVLQRLRDQVPLSAELLSDPAKLLDALLASPQAQAMGKTLQEQMQGIATASSSTDYLLAAIHLQLDPQASAEPHRNTVAGFDLAAEELIGKPTSTLLRRLSEHLVSQGTASPEMANAAAYLLLASRAPVFLIKNIPASVTYGSPAWVNLAVAAATIEAQTPGKVANMTFAQVMLEARSASVADPVVTQRAQLEALVDWGVASGVLPRKDDHLYTADELNTLTQQFNTRKQQMMAASAALDNALPSRRELALAKLKERFGDLGELFEKKVIEIKRRVPWLDDGKSYNSDASNPHSMLDVAMMELQDKDVTFFSSDSRIPVAALNANRTFGVVEPFNQQFDHVISAKKAAIATYIKHLVSQLPVEDRKKFEYGKLELFQTSSYTEGTGLSSSTDQAKAETLLVKVSYNGFVLAYEIDFNKGRIKQTFLSRVGAKQTKVAHDVITTKAFTPPGSEALRQANPVSDTAVPDSFTSARTQLLADAFVKHLDLDNPLIKAQARGLTTLDKHEQKIDAIKEFALNLVPLRSAIVNFQKGNYAEGALDLALDVFSFVTAGAGAAGKVIRVAGSALSTVNKVLKAAKVIGAATIGVLNPLDGVGDALAGGSRLAAKGVRFLTTKGAEYVNTLRGATGSYDLLKNVSKEHGPSLIGTYKVGGVETEGVAVLKNNHWYKYDHLGNTLYGLPIEDFSPRGAHALQTGSSDAAKRESMGLYNNLMDARAPQNLPAFNRGYSTGRLEALTGYRPNMTSRQIKAMAVASNRRPDEMGILARELKRAYLEDAKYVSALLAQDVAGPGVKVTPVSQIHFNAQVDLPSIGECAGMSYAMAFAIHTGKEDQFVKNMIKVADYRNTPGGDKFINDLRTLQAKVQNSGNFHYGAQIHMAGSRDIIDELANYRTSTTLRIGTRDHAMLAGVRVENGVKEWFFYDPNSGLVKFDNETSMRNGMEKVLETGKIAAISDTPLTATGARQYSVSEFELSDMNRPGIDTAAIKAFSDSLL